MKGMRRANAGVTLMELLTVVVIVGLLSAIAIPSYRSYVQRANRTDAKTGLLSLAGALERCYTRENTYTTGSCANLIAQLPITVASGNYQVNAGGTGILPASYVIWATPQGSQAADTKCGTFTLDDKNTRGISGGTGTWQECWGR